MRWQKQIFSDAYLLALLLTAQSGKRLWTDWKAMLEELREAVLEIGNRKENEWRQKLKILRQRERKLQRL